MGSNYFGEGNLRSERSGGSSSSSSSSRKGKKNNSDKPRQPQRGLGVAQLEKIRLHSQMGCGFIPSLQTHPYPITNPNQEDIRVQAAYSSSSSFSYTSPSSTSYGFHGNQSTMIGLGEFESANIRYGDSQPSNNNARWNTGNTAVEAQHYQPSITRHLLNLEVEESIGKKKKGRSDSVGSGSQNSGSSGSQELDLELRLSL